MPNVHIITRPIHPSEHERSEILIRLPEHALDELAQQRFIDALQQLCEAQAEAHFGEIECLDVTFGDTLEK